MWWLPETWALNHEPSSWHMCISILTIRTIIRRDCKLHDCKWKCQKPQNCNLNSKRVQNFNDLILAPKPTGKYGTIPCLHLTPAPRMPQSQCPTIGKLGKTRVRCFFVVASRLLFLAFVLLVFQASPKTRHQITTWWHPEDHRPWRFMLINTSRRKQKTLCRHLIMIGQDQKSVSRCYCAGTDLLRSYLIIENY